MVGFDEGLERRQGGQAAVTRPTPKQVRAHPGLKLQTQLEEHKTDLRRLSDRQRWEYLFSLNVWKPSK